MKKFFDRVDKWCDEHPVANTILSAIFAFGCAIVFCLLAVILIV